MREPSRNSVCASARQSSKGYAGILRIGDVIDLAMVPCYDGTSHHRSFTMNPDICVSMCPHGPGPAPGDDLVGGTRTPHLGYHRASGALSAFRSPWVGSSNSLALVRGGPRPPAPRATSFLPSGCPIAAC